MENRIKPARWRKAVRPHGMNNMSRMIWERQHGGAKELWRGDDHLATAYEDGQWIVHAGQAPGRGHTADLATAKRAAKHSLEAGVP